MMNSYDIQTAGHIDTLKLICKSSLKANQLIDIGDMDGYQKASKVYNDLMKSGNFTASQNKADKGEFINSIGELVMICEKEGFIPRYYVDEPHDKVDATIRDLQQYTRRLVLEETNLGALIERAVRQIQEDSERADHNDPDDENFEDSLFDTLDDSYLTDDDIADFYKWSNDDGN